MSQPLLSISQYYHQRTKYEPEILGSSNRRLDPSQQPSPFKSYKIGAAVDLRPHLESLQVGTADAAAYHRLSRFLFFSYGITAVIPYPDNPFYLRAAPSAGGLYPAEVYMIVRDGAFLPAGLYNYQAKEHVLYRYWDSYVWSRLEEACLWHPAISRCHLAIVVTAVFQRSAWRYEDRAYRRIFLDSGHLLGNITLSANLHDFRPHLIGGFQDDLVNEILYLDGEQEGAIALAALTNLRLVSENLAPTPTVLPSKTLYDFPPLPEGELLRYCHQATRILNQDSTYAELTQPHVTVEAPSDQYNFPFGLKLSMETEPISWGDHCQYLAQTIVDRRSTRSYSAQSIQRDDLAKLLDFTYHAEHYFEQGLDPSPDYFDLGYIQTFVAILNVDGLEAGCYYYAVNAQELRQIRFKNFCQEIHYLCLQQNLGRDAAAVFFHTANLETAIAAYGDRAYRYLHMDAGHLGQRLNLAAIRLGLGVSGIGGFFDDEVNEVLGIPLDEAVLYITTVGRPLRNSP